MASAVRMRAGRDPITHRDHRLRDDATILLVEWHPVRGGRTAGAGSGDGDDGETST
ncbi:hypothetical protein [Kitasatospora sp. NPDC005856]|uniref:hypothetical protein n=1 Tax=Kitasatospora sp. NPDC005856 TaxID=3154566 RepID=UPI0033C4FDD1